MDDESGASMEPRIHYVYTYEPFILGTEVCQYSWHSAGSVGWLTITKCCKHNRRACFATAAVQRCFLKYCCSLGDTRGCCFSLELLRLSVLLRYNRVMRKLW